MSNDAEKGVLQASSLHDDASSNEIANVEHVENDIADQKARRK
jgi:hypothetical protein